MCVTSRQNKERQPQNDWLVMMCVQGIRHIAVLISSSAEGGLQAVQASHVRMSDATSPVPAQQPSLGWLCFPGPPASKASNLMLCKLHKVWMRVLRAHMNAKASLNDLTKPACHT